MDPGFLLASQPAGLRAPPRVAAVRRAGPSRARASSRPHRAAADYQSRSDPPAPDFETLVPENDHEYARCEVYAIGPRDRDGLDMISLRPLDEDVEGKAFRMVVTDLQTQAIESALRGDYQNNDPNQGPVKKRIGNVHYREDPATLRPSTHDLLHAALQVHGARVIKGVISHLRDAAFFAHIWVTFSPEDDAQPHITHMDARPSDVVALCTLFESPIYVRKALIASNGRALRDIEADVAALHTHWAPLPPRKMTEQMEIHPGEITVVYSSHPTYKKLSVLKTRLDLAEKLDRFTEARQLADEIRQLFPLDFLQIQLGAAVEDQRFEEAAKLRDEIRLWQLTLMQWEHDPDQHD